MPSEAVAIVSDAHLGHAPDVVAVAFRRFVNSLPGVADHLVINGDLFDFWFEYQRVIPRDAFPTLSALSEARSRGLRLTVTGGNHDRWGGDFWIKEMGAAFYGGPAEIQLGGRKAFVAHGDGLAETRPLSRFMHGVTRHPLAAGLFRLVHPDWGFWFADRLSGILGEKTKSPEALARAAAAQEAFALDLMARREELDLVILGHTHRAVVRQVGPGRWYVNPGAWMLDSSYVMLNADGPVLRHFDGTG